MGDERNVYIQFTQQENAMLNTVEDVSDRLTRDQK